MTPGSGAHGAGTPGANNVNLLVEMVLLNYLALHGDQNQFATLFPTHGLGDPANLDRDRGPNPLDMRHNFTGNIVYVSTSHASNAFVRQLLSGNQIGALLQFNSGLPINEPANRDLNGDGVN